VAVNADVEIGGTDQLFNLLFGREIQKAYGQEPQDIAVFPLLEGRDGEQKMSKSLGNYIGISEAPEEIYGKTMSIPDRLIEKYMRLISGLEPDRQAEILAMKPRDSKAALAFQIVKRLHADDAARRAEEDFNVKFRKREIPQQREKWDKGPTDFVSLLVETGIASSRNDARRLLEQGGVKVNGEKVGVDSPAPKSGDVVSGRRRYIELE
ncbi:MAG TPA: tyrosine--tRNA ligase, partial [Candidatus Dormibacteraeota bacterium]